MYGKPMISSENGTGTTFINIANKTGLVVPPSDPAALRQAMQYLWQHPEQATEMGRRAEERYWQHFTAVQMVRSYVDLYGDLAKSVLRKTIAQSLHSFDDDAMLRAVFF